MWNTVPVSTKDWQKRLSTITKAEYVERREMDHGHNQSEQLQLEIEGERGIIMRSRNESGQCYKKSWEKII